MHSHSVGTGTCPLWKRKGRGTISIGEGWKIGNRFVPVLPLASAAGFVPFVLKRKEPGKGSSPAAKEKAAAEKIFMMGKRNSVAEKAKRICGRRPVLPM